MPSNVMLLQWLKSETEISSPAEDHPLSFGHATENMVFPLFTPGKGVINPTVKPCLSQLVSQSYQTIEVECPTLQCITRQTSTKI